MPLKNRRYPKNATKNARRKSFVRITTPKYRTLRTLIIIKLFLVPPIEAKLSGGVDIYIAGQVYNISCKVTGSNPPSKIKVLIGLRQLEALDYQVRHCS